MIVFCSLLTGKLVRDASTMGAEKRAPPGMGSNPIKAVMTDPTVLGSPERREKLATRRSIWPASFMILLMTMINQTIMRMLIVCRLVALARMTEDN